jgi:F-type H+-transporting ATPase subunit delta
MRTGSRDAFGQASEELERIVSGSSGQSGSSAPAGGPTGSSGGSGERLGELGTELFGIANALGEHIDLRRHLVDPSVPARARTSLVEGVFGSKVSQQAAGLLSTLADHRVSTSTDLVECVELLGRDATLAGAEADGTLSEVEDELFRFGRLLEREPRLRTLLADSRAAPDKRVELLTSVLGGRVEKPTARLLEQLVRHPYARSIDRGAEVMAEAAAARRDRSIALVTAPVALGEQQENRLAESLSSLYGRRISVHVDVDPEILGGLVVRVGGEVIDGSISGRLRGAEQALPG